MGRIFIVDDEDDVRKLYERILIMNGFEILPTARNGKEAVEMFKQFDPKPDIILMDYLMPILNGLEASKEILAINKNIKIMMISSDSTAERKALEIGVKKFFQKTISLAKIVQTIKEIMDEKVF